MATAIPTQKELADEMAGYVRVPEVSIALLLSNIREGDGPQANGFDRGPSPVEIAAFFGAVHTLRRFGLIPVIKVAPVYPFAEALQLFAVEPPPAYYEQLREEIIKAAIALAKSPELAEAKDLLLAAVERYDNC